MPTSPEAKTCAVLVIHGVGEQRPMSTLRSFVEGVLDAETAEPKFFNKPDQLADTFELRKLQNRKQPRVHFYEYYWAYKSEGTTFSHVGSWFSTLLLRRPTANNVPPGLWLLYFICWGTILCVVAALCLGVWQWYSDVVETFPAWVVPVVGAVLGAVVNLVVLRYIGDAARYLSPAPANIRMRHDIRSEGVQLLRKMHDKGYGRIVVVGHSLGSVIAYDILKQLWIEYSDKYDRPRRDGQPRLAENERRGQTLAAGWKPGDDVKKRNDPDDYRAAQKQLWKELKSLGGRWRVTDFVTLGSPLAHAAALMAADRNDLEQRQRERELPTCPPVPEIEKQNLYDKQGNKTGEKDVWRFGWTWYEFPYGDGSGQKYFLRWVHNAGLFACTRWTNGYFPAALGFFGDFVGGPLRGVFGPGIKDVRVPTRRSRRWAHHTLLAHLQYWSRPRRPDDPHDDALARLIDALDLDDRSFFDDEL